MRYLYSFLFYLALPFIFIRLGWKSRRLPAYRERLGERIGIYPFTLDKCLWIHAVSVGETLAAIPLIKALQIRYPHLPILITTMTPTGAARVKASFGDTVKHAYIPYDVPDAIKRFLNAMHPVIGIIMETELWPNMFAICQQKKIPICIVNARLSEKSAQSYQRIATLTREMLQHVNKIAAHGEIDAKRFIALGAQSNRVAITGNIKFDLELPSDLAEKSAALRALLGLDRFIWIAASTHEGEDEFILAAQKKIMEKNPHALLILVPRHPDRFEHVAKLCEKNFITSRRSKQQKVMQETAVYLGDTMGELLLLYAVADVAFVGGSLIPRGGHNILEPAALGMPMLTGPHVFNFAEISELFFSVNALIKVVDAESLAEQLIRLMHNPSERAAMGARAHQVMHANRGALEKQLAIIHSIVSGS